MSKIFTPEINLSPSPRAPAPPVIKRNGLMMKVSVGDGKSVRFEATMSFANAQRLCEYMAAQPA